jgi:hypothetical protein
LNISSTKRKNPFSFTPSFLSLLFGSTDLVMLSSLSGLHQNRISLFLIFTLA